MVNATKACNHKVFEVCETVSNGWSATAEISNMDGVLYLDLYLCKPGEVSTKANHRRTTMRYCPRCGENMAQRVGENNG